MHTVANDISQGVTGDEWHYLWRYKNRVTSYRGGIIHTLAPWSGNGRREDEDMPHSDLPSKPSKP